jgi:hypothetical protein
VKDFSEVLAEITHGKPLDLSKEEERVNPDESKDDDGQDQTKESDGQLDGEPESESKEDKEEEGRVEDKPEKESEATSDTKSESDETKDKDEAESEEKDGEKEAEPTFEIDGETYTLSQLREMRDSGLRLEDYTRKTMDAAKERKEFLEQQRSRESLASDIAEDAGLQQFLAARPEALANLMAKPESTRKLLGNPKAVQEFWADYDIIKKNPRLAEIVAKDDADESEIDAELRRAQEVESMNTIVGTLEQFVGQISEHELYKDLGEDAAMDVLRYIAGLSGVPENPTHEQQFEGVSKLFKLFFHQQEDGEWSIDHRLIQGEFERIKDTKNAVATEQKKDEPKENEIDEHNKRVDQQLNDEERPPKTPDGQPPATEQEAPNIPDSFHGILRELRK